MGTYIALARASTLHDSNGRSVPLEFSMVAIFPSRPRSLRGGVTAAQTGVSDPGYSGAWTRRVDERYRVDLPHEWFARFPAYLDLSWIGFGLGLFGVPATSLRFSTLAASGDYILCVTGHIHLHPDKRRSSPI